MQEILEFFTIKWSKPWFLTCFAITSLGKPCTGSQDAKAGNLNPGVEFSGKNWSTQEIYELTKAELANVGIQPTKLELVSIFYIYIYVYVTCVPNKKVHAISKNLKRKCKSCILVACSGSNHEFHIFLKEEQTSRCKVTEGLGHSIAAYKWCYSPSENSWRLGSALQWVYSLISARKT